MKRGPAVLACLLAGLAGLAQAADIYRWTDAQGKVHFSQTAPAGTQRVEVKPQVMERDEATRQSEARIEQLFKVRGDERAAAQQKAAKAQAQREAGCTKWRVQLAELNHGRRFYSEAENGQRTYYSDAQVDTARRQLSARLSEDCP
ncbi:MAG: hypothetical protein GAK43_01442 [Stenotrophomonas maltophilia]|nr:MAG: hypothetical protein GAK43_01442 [Stenotrophomonas maltophilia]